MDLRGLVNSAIQPINTDISIIWERSTGYQTDTAGKRTPTISSATIYGNVQATDAEDLKHLDALNMQGVYRSVYMYGNPQGVVRVDAKGGDILKFAEVPNEAVKRWKVVHVKETWSNWANVIVELQL